MTPSLQRLIINGYTGLRLLTSSAPPPPPEDTGALIYSLSLNVVLFGVLMLLFEACRRAVSELYNRPVKRLSPPTAPMVSAPVVSPRPLGWLCALSSAPSGDALLRLVGVDGYMLLRYLRLCCKLCFLYSLVGVAILVPIYAGAEPDPAQPPARGWYRFTLAHVSGGSPEGGGTELWAPVVCLYLFAVFFCVLMRRESEHFIGIRLRLLQDETDSPPLLGRSPTASHLRTIMLERVPPDLRSTATLVAFMRSVFPAESVVAVSLVLQLDTLDRLVATRRQVWDALEGALCVYSRTGRRPVLRVSGAHYSRVLRLRVAGQPIEREDIGYLVRYAAYPPSGGWDVDALSYTAFLLQVLNGAVEAEQRACRYAPEEGDRDEPPRRIRNSVDRGWSYLELATRRKEPRHEDGHHEQEECAPETGGCTTACLHRASVPGRRWVADCSRFLSTLSLVLLRSCLSRTHTRADRAPASTAFVTFSSRAAHVIAVQTLLSHDYRSLVVIAAPHPSDLIWRNLPRPLSEMETRRTLARLAFAVGALCWSLVVAAVNGWAQLDDLSERQSWLQRYADSAWYRLANQYLAVVLLLILLAVLPYVFDFSARHYEGIKTESGTQASILTRYFYYQLANVIVSVFSGTLWEAAQRVLYSPLAVLDVLGRNLPERSVFFAILVSTRTLVGLPVELLRVWPTLSLLSQKLSRRVAGRDTLVGAPTPPPLQLGWVYPQLFMVLLIATTYAPIAPLLLPVCTGFFLFAYAMYIYQVLYVFETSSHSDGYAAFNWSMVALMCGVLTTAGYLGVRRAYCSGPFYATLPLPALLVAFWVNCNRKYVPLSTVLSLQRAVQMDGRGPPLDIGGPGCYTQPSLMEGPLPLPLCPAVEHLEC